MADALPEHPRAHEHMPPGGRPVIFCQWASAGLASMHPFPIHTVKSSVTKFWAFRFSYKAGTVWSSFGSFSSKQQPPAGYFPGALRSTRVWRKVQWLALIAGCRSQEYGPLMNVLQQHQQQQQRRNENSLHLQCTQLLDYNNSTRRQ